MVLELLQSWYYYLLSYFTLMNARVLYFAAKMSNVFLKCEKTYLFTTFRFVPCSFSERNVSQIYYLL